MKRLYGVMCKHIVHAWRLEDTQVFSFCDVLLGSLSRAPVGTNRPPEKEKEWKRCRNLVLFYYLLIHSRGNGFEWRNVRLHPLVKTAISFPASKYRSTYTLTDTEKKEAHPLYWKADTHAKLQFLTVTYISITPSVTCHMGHLFKNPQVRPECAEQKQKSTNINNVWPQKKISHHMATHHRRDVCLAINLSLGSKVTISSWNSHHSVYFQGAETYTHTHRLTLHMYHQTFPYT